AKAEYDRLEQRSKRLWVEVDGEDLNTARSHVLFDPSDDAAKMARYEKSNAAEVHKCLNQLARKRRDEGRSENRAKRSVNGVSQAVSSTNGHGHGHEPFAIPQPLADRLAADLSAPAAAVASENSAI